jgi:hypothetical protein
MREIEGVHSHQMTNLLTEIVDGLIANMYYQYYEISDQLAWR